MNLFDYEGKEFDKKLDEIFKNKDKEELKQELIECGLKVGVDMKEDIKDIQKILTALDNTTKEQLDKAIKNVDKEWSEKELKEDIKNSFNRIETIMNNEVCEFNKTIIEGNLNVIKRYIENLIKGYKELEIENKTLKAHKNGCPALPTTGVECEFKKVTEYLDKMEKRCDKPKFSVMKKEIEQLLQEGDK